MQQFFNSLYTVSIGLLYDRKTPLYGLYKAEIFNATGLYTVLTALALVVVFYYVFNHFIPALTHQGLYRPIHWLLVLLLVAGLGALLAWRVSIGQGATSDPYMRYFILTNTWIAPLWFILFSVALKWGSHHARRTPF
jgi:predicted PurR-regulated permease PerM